LKKGPPQKNKKRQKKKKTKERRKKKKKKKKKKEKRRKKKKKKNKKKHKKRKKRKTPRERDFEKWALYGALDLGQGFENHLAKKDGLSPKFLIAIREAIACTSGGDSRNSKKFARQLKTFHLGFSPALGLSTL